MLLPEVQCYGERPDLDHCSAVNSGVSLPSVATAEANSAVTSARRVAAMAD